MRKFGKLLSIAVVVPVGMFLAAPARANIIPTLSSVTLLTSGPNTGDYLWSYDVIVTDTEAVVANSAAPTSTSGNYLTMYDIAGLVNGSETEPAGWTGSVQNVGVTPNTEAPTDSGTVANVTWDYFSGPDIDGFADAGGLSMTPFAFVSTLGTQITGSNFYATEATVNGGTENGTQDQNDGHITAPTTAAPLPSASMIGLALCGLVVLGNRYYKRSMV